MPRPISYAVFCLKKKIYAPDGSLNRALDALGLGSLARPWLVDFTSALPSIGFVGTWVMSGLALLFFIADHQNLHSFPTRRSSDLSVEHDQKTGLTTFGQFHQHHSQMPRD